jgi:hypothetical protein
MHIPRLIDHNGHALYVSPSLLILPLISFSTVVVMRFSICGLATDEMKSPGKRRKRDKNGDGKQRNEGRGFRKNKIKHYARRQSIVYPG